MATTKIGNADNPVNAPGGVYVGTTQVIDSSGDVVAGVSAGDITLTDTYLLVGNGSNVATGVAMSGDATIANTGAVTVSSAGGTWTRDGITSTSGAGAVAITGSVHEVTTTGTGDALTLADGAAGQRLSILYVAEGAGSDTAVITPTTLAGGTTITLNALGDSADLIFSATGGWYVLGLGGTAAVA